jgi:hypothetical protein
LDISLRELDLFDFNSKLINKVESSEKLISSSLLSEPSNIDHELTKNDSAMPSNLMKSPQITNISKSNENCSSESNLNSQPNSLPNNFYNLEDNLTRNNFIHNSNHSAENIFNTAENYDKHDYTSHLVSSVSNLREVNIEQNLSARISHEVCVSSSDSIYHNKNEIPFSLKLNNEIKNGRKKSLSTARYATVSNFTIPIEMNFPNEGNSIKPLSNSVEVVINIFAYYFY